MDGYTQVMMSIRGLLHLQVGLQPFVRCELIYMHTRPVDDENELNFMRQPALYCTEWTGSLGILKGLSMIFNMWDGTVPVPVPVPNMRTCYNC